MLRNIFYIIFSIHDSIIWFFLKLLPNKIIIRVIKRKFWKTISLKLNYKYRVSLQKIVVYCSEKRRLSNFFNTSCLSRALTCSIIFDLFEINHFLCLGMVLNQNNEKIPHAWIEDNSNVPLTQKYNEKKGIFLTHL